MQLAMAGARRKHRNIAGARRFHVRFHRPRSAWTGLAQTREPCGRSGGEFVGGLPRSLLGARVNPTARALGLHYMGLRKGDRTE
jgi:hypothetical protein